MYKPKFVDNLSEIYKKECKDVRKEEKSNQYVILVGLNIINYIMIRKNVKKDGYIQ